MHRRRTQSDRGVFAISVPADPARCILRGDASTSAKGWCSRIAATVEPVAALGADVKRFPLIAAFTTSGLNLAGVSRLLALET